jgi:hypothetical protein
MPRSENGYSVCVIAKSPPSRHDGRLLKMQIILCEKTILFE